MQSEPDDGWWEDDCPLPDVPPVDLPDDPEPEPADALDEIVRSDRDHNATAGHRALWVLQLLRETTPIGGGSARDLVAGEIGPALGLGSGAAVKLVDISVALHQRLPATLRAVCDGRLSWYKATVLAEAVAPLTDDQARQVEQQVLPKAAGRTPAQHANAVRRAVAQGAPDGVDARRKAQQKTIRMIRTHYGDGMGDLWARMPSEGLDTFWSGCDFWARSRKAQGDPRSIDELRVAAMIQCGQSLLHHGDPEYCLQWCEPGSHGGPVHSTDDGSDDSDADDDSDGEAGPDDNGPDDEPDGDAPADGTGSELEPVDEPSHDVEPMVDERPASTPPTRHGRRAALHAIWDLTSLLGLTRHCGELTDSGAMMPPDAMTELVAGGVKIRRMLIDPDPDSGELVDLTPRTWRLPRTKPTELDAPVGLGAILDTNLWHATADGSADSKLLAAIERAPQPLRDLRAHPVTADFLDNTPGAYPAPARLAEFIAMRTRPPPTPTAGPTAASPADIEHVTPAGKGGTSTREVLTTNVRRWHNLKTH